MNIMKRFFYVMSLNWILTTQLIILITGITLFKVLGGISQSWL